MIILEDVSISTLTSFLKGMKSNLDKNASKKNGDLRLKIQ